MDGIEKAKWKDKVEGLLSDMDLSELVRDPLKNVFLSLIERFSGLKESNTEYQDFFKEGLDNERIAEVVKDEFAKYEGSIKNREKDREKSAIYYLSNFLKNEIGFSGEDIKTILKFKEARLNKKIDGFYKLMRETGFDFFILYKKKYVSLEDFQRSYNRNKCPKLSEFFSLCVIILKEILEIKIALSIIDVEDILRNEIPKLEEELPYCEREEIGMISELFKQASELYEKGIKKKFRDEEIERRKDRLTEVIIEINKLYKEIKTNHHSLTEYFTADMIKNLRFSL